MQAIATPQDALEADELPNSRGGMNELLSPSTDERFVEMSPYELLMCVDAWLSEGGRE